MNKKYEFTGETKIYKGRELRRIRRIKDGLIGGWIESERNLSQKGDCFVYDEGMVYGNGKVYGNSIVYGNGKVFGNGEVFGNGKISDNGMVYGNGMVFHNGMIFGNGVVYDKGLIYGNGVVCDNGKVFGYGEVCDNGRVCKNGLVHGDGVVFGQGEVCGKGEVFKGKIIGVVSLPYKDIFQYQCKNRALTAILTEDDEILYTVGCQKNMTKETFLFRIYNENGGLEENPHRKEYLKLIPLIEQYFKN